MSKSLPKVIMDFIVRKYKVDDLIKMMSPKGVGSQHVRLLKRIMPGSSRRRMMMILKLILVIMIVVFNLVHFKTLKIEYFY